MSLRRDRFAGVSLIFSLLLNAGAWGLLLWKIPFTEETVLLHYNVFFGVDATGEWFQIFTIPIAGVVIFLLNTLVMLRVKRMDLFMRRLFAVLTVLMQGVILLAALLLVLLNN